MTDWWIIPLGNGCQCTNLSNGKTVFVSISQLANCRVKDCADYIKGGSDNLSVVHFPVGGDVGIFEMVDRFIAKRFDGSSRIFAALYSEGTQRDLKRVMESSESRNVMLVGGDWHSVAPIKVAA